MAGAMQLVTLGFILVAAGAVRPSGVCSAHNIAYLRCTVVLAEGATGEVGEEAGPLGPRCTD
jgi:hypothetical protein